MENRVCNLYLSTTDQKTDTANANRKKMMTLTMQIMNIEKSTSVHYTHLWMAQNRYHHIMKLRIMTKFEI